MTGKTLVTPEERHRMIAEKRRTSWRKTVVSRVEIWFRTGLKPSAELTDN